MTEVGNIPPSPSHGKRNKGNKNKVKQSKGVLQIIDTRSEKEST